MFCSQCGTPNDDNAYKCTSCGKVLQQPVAPKKIDNNLVLAIVVTVLCCMPFGIVALIQAAQVNAKVAGDDIAGAEESARKALKWSLWGLGIGIVFYGLYFAFVVFAALSGGSLR